MVYSFIEKDTACSEYVKIINKIGLKGMLSAYGAYTCIAPNNEAFRKYYNSLGENFNIDSLTNEQLNYVAKTHIVSNKYLFSELTVGIIPKANMNERFIEISFTADSITNAFKIMLNDSSQVISRDNEVYNGVVHKIDRVIQPSNYQLPELIYSNPDISIFAEALKLTKLEDSLRLVKDEDYSPQGIYHDAFDSYIIINPKERKYGYTAFIEDNEILKENGINSIDDLITKAKEWYPTSSEYDGDYTNPENSLNKYMAYHLIKKVIFLNKFFYTSHAINDYTPDEFLETIYTNRLIRASKIGSRIGLNFSSTNYTKIKEEGSKTTVNGVYHLLSEPLIYSEDVENMMQNIRIRFDPASLLPELTNNNMRCSRGFTDFPYGDDYGFDDGYLDYVQMSKDTRLIYLAGNEDGGWCSFQGDELMALGAYDLTIRLLPMPPGTYEFRYGYSTNSYRSITQIYIDGKPIGIPLDLRIYADNPKIGWILDGLTDDSGYENDKMMRNRGYMKGPTTFGPTKDKIARDHNASLRRIVGTFTFTKYEAHYLRLKTVEERPSAQLDIDFFEFVPKSVFSPADGTPESRD